MDFKGVGVNPFVVPLQVSYETNFCFKMFHAHCEKILLHAGIILSTTRKSTVLSL